MNLPNSTSLPPTEQVITPPCSTPESSCATAPANPSESLRDLLKAEAPLLSLPSGASLLAPEKPLVEMTPEELSNWHARLRDNRNHMTMMAHIAAVGVSTVKKETKAAKKVDISEFV